MASSLSGGSLSSSKRPAVGGGGQTAGTGVTDEPPKKRHILGAPNTASLGSVSTQEEMDMRVLQFQNRKLSERLERQKSKEEDLRVKIEQLEKRQEADEAALCLVNRYWMLLDEDMRIMLERFQLSADTVGNDVKINPTIKQEFDSQDSASRPPTDQTEITPYLSVKKEPEMIIDVAPLGSLAPTQPSDSGKSPMLLTTPDEESGMSVKGGVVGRYESKDVLYGGDMDSNDSLSRDGIEPGSQVTSDDNDDKENTVDMATMSFLQLLSSNDDKEIEQKLESRVAFTKLSVSKLLTVFNQLKMKCHKINSMLTSDSGTVSSIDEVVKQHNIELETDNKKLESMVTELHKKHHYSSSKFSELENRTALAENKIAEMKNVVEDLEFDRDKQQQRCEKLELSLTDLVNKNKQRVVGDVLVEERPTNEEQQSHQHVSVAQKKFDEHREELEEQRRMAQGRLNELEKLQEEHAKTEGELQKLRVDSVVIPEDRVLTSTEYKCLQSQFSVLYNENIQLKAQLDEYRNLLQGTKNNHLRQIEQMESDELSCQKKLRTEVMQLEDTLAQVRKEYEMLRIEFEQNLAANEQAGPLTQEMRHMISSLQKNNHHLKSEVSRYRRKLREAMNEIMQLRTTGGDSSKLKQDLDNSSNPPTGGSVSSNKDTPQTPSHNKEQDSSSNQSQNSNPPTTGGGSTLGVSKTVGVGGKPGSGPTSVTPSSGLLSPGKTEAAKESEEKRTDPEIIKDLRQQLKKSQDREKEMKLLLDVYKGAPKEQRDKVQLMAAERRVKNEVDDLKQKLKSLEEQFNSDQRIKTAEEEATKKVKVADDTIHSLQKQLSSRKQEEDTLLSEMEVTGQAFEDMQEQNTRVIQQLKEKDDANFKLMSERIKAQQIQKLLREEKDVLIEQVHTLQTQVEAQNQVVRKLEEKERILQNTAASQEKELNIRVQAAEQHRKKALECAQEVADLKLILDKAKKQIECLEKAIKLKVTELEEEQFRTRRIKEENLNMRKKLERLKRMDQANSADEVLVEEIRMYKGQLTCPCCNTRSKDAILTKCFHVFCFDCLKRRYDTRQRKCPKCNLAFGANDFHRIYF